MAGPSLQGQGDVPDTRCGFFRTSFFVGCGRWRHYRVWGVFFACDSAADDFLVRKKVTNFTRIYIC